MNGRNWNVLRRYTCGSKGLVSGLLHHSDGRVVGTGCSLVSYKELARSRQAMAVPASALVVGAILPTRVASQSCSRSQYTHSFAASSISGCVNTMRRIGWSVRTSRPSNGQSPVEFMCISTAAFREQALAPAFYRKRRKKGKGRGTQAFKHPGGEVTQESPAGQKVEEKCVVIVESPAKAKTIEKYLGERHVVLASFGHVRDLAAKTGSVRPDDDFKLVWEVPSSARQHLNSMKAAITGAQSLVLASDPDREGEAIAWHVLEMLKLEGALEKGLKVKRVVFNEITKAAVLQAMAAPRDISPTLVDAYLARRALDYLIGFDLSPVLWRKLPGSKSAGRVQSAALRLVCEREIEMETFVAREHWSVETQMCLPDTAKKSSTSTADSHAHSLFPAKVTHVDGEKLSQFSLCNKAQAQAVAERVEMSRFAVSSVKKSILRRNPAAPYITSTLQQDASSKLAFGASRTMALAQQLYEGVKLDNDELTGLITYMRTDGVQLSQEAVQNIRSLITKRYGNEYTPRQPRQFASKVKNAQEAHEAIRPTDINRLPSMLMKVLDGDALRLYSLIWCRTIACQMEQAIFAQVAVDITNDAEDLQLKATGSSLSFPGFLVAMKDKVALSLVGDSISDTDEGGDSPQGENLRSLEAGDPISLDKATPNQHFTEPPPRFSEGSLVKRLEELGIGRPSTYASTLKTLHARTYVKIEKRRIFPESRGRMVSAFLLHYFPKFSDYSFTAKMETQLDEISAGNVHWKKVLGEFWPEFHEGVKATLNVPFDEVVGLLEHVFAEQFFSGSVERTCPTCLEGKMGLKLSRFGAGYFLGCSRYPDCLYKTDVLSADGDESSDSDENEIKPSGDKVLGQDPASGLEVTLKEGPYGKYVQMGSGSKKQKPKRIALHKSVSATTFGLAEALELLKYPYELGRHPEFDVPILVGTGHYGLFVRCRGSFASITQESLATLTVEEAVALLASKHSSKRGRFRKAEDGTNANDKPVSDNQPDTTKASATSRVKGPKTGSSKMSKSPLPETAGKAKNKLAQDTKKVVEAETQTKLVGKSPVHGVGGKVDGKKKQSGGLAGKQANGAVDAKKKHTEKVGGNQVNGVMDSKKNKSDKLTGVQKMIDKCPGDEANGATEVKKRQAEEVAGETKVLEKISGEDVEGGKVKEKVKFRKGRGRPQKGFYSSETLPVEVNAR